MDKYKKKEIDSLSVKIKNSIILKGLSKYWPTRVIDFMKGDLEVNLFVIKDQGDLDYIERLKGQTSKKGTNANIFLGFTYGKMFITEDELKHYMLIDQEQQEAKTITLSITNDLPISLDISEFEEMFSVEDRELLKRGESVIFVDRLGEKHEVIAVNFYDTGGQV